MEEKVLTTRERVLLRMLEDLSQLMKSYSNPIYVLPSVPSDCTVGTSNLIEGEVEVIRPSEAIVELALQMVIDYINKEEVV